MHITYMMKKVPNEAKSCNFPDPFGLPLPLLEELPKEEAGKPEGAETGERRFLETSVLRGLPLFLFNTTGSEFPPTESVTTGTISVFVVLGDPINAGLTVWLVGVEFRDGFTVQF